jgi:hypothetical protein
MKVEFLEADLHYIHGVVPAIVPRGTGFQVDPANDLNLILANGTSGHQLERDVVAALTLQDIAFPDGYVKPYALGATVSARRVTRMQIEGTDVILTSGTGAVSGATPVNTALSYSAGRLRVAQGGDETAFIIREQLTPEDPTQNFRLLLERP